MSRKPTFEKVKQDLLNANFSYEFESGVHVFTKIGRVPLDCIELRMTGLSPNEDEAVYVQIKI